MDSPSEIFDGGRAFLRWASTRSRQRGRLAALLPQRLDPPLRCRRDERLPARLPDEDLLLQLLPEAVELHVHLSLLATGAVQVGLIPRVLRDEHDHPARAAASGSTAPLNRRDLRRPGPVEPDEVDLRDVEDPLADP